MLHPTVISTFSGCGGSSLGYKLAGMSVRLAVEMDRHAVETYKLNFSDTPVYEGDIHQLTVQEVLKITDLQKGALDILDGSPPCQGFSVAGLRKFSDDRNSLFREFVRLAKGLQPKVVVMENVPGLVIGKMRLLFAEMVTALEQAGYRVAVRVLNAKYYGVPQSRKRVIFIGVRKDLRTHDGKWLQPSHPVGTERLVSFSEAVKGLPVDTTDSLDEFAKRLWELTKPGRSFADNHPKGHWFNTIKVHPNRPAPTVTKTCFRGRALLLHHRFPRSLTIEELKRVASFPDHFKFEGKFTEQWARIGNAVPPNFMRRIAEHLRSNILECMQHDAPVDRIEEDMA